MMQVWNCHCSNAALICAVVRVQGHFQIIFNRKYCPLFRAKLPFLSRLLYCSGVWAYCVNALLTPIFMVRRLCRHHRPSKLCLICSGISPL